MLLRVRRAGRVQEWLAGGRRCWELRRMPWDRLWPCSHARLGIRSRWRVGAVAHWMARFAEVSQVRIVKQEIVLE